MIAASAAEDVEVVPLDDRAGGRGRDHLPDAVKLIGFNLGFADTSGRHASPPSWTSRPLATYVSAAQRLDQLTRRPWRDGRRLRARPSRRGDRPLRLGYLIHLHSHSTASDGSHSPAALVALAKRQGLTALALTDHDTVEGLAEARKAAAEVGIRLVEGCELSCEVGEAYSCISSCTSSPTCRAVLPAGWAAGHESRPQRCNFADGAGRARVDITLQQILDEAGGGSAGRPHVAGVLVNKGYVGSVQEAFDVWLGKGKPGYLELEPLLPVDAISLAHASGAVTGRSRRSVSVGFDGRRREEFVAGLVADGPPPTRARPLSPGPAGRAAGPGRAVRPGRDRRQ